VSEARTARAVRTVRFVGGKGGVGKTTTATALASVAAARGHRTLLVSTDPAHSTGDLLRTPLSGEPTEVAAGLWAVEIDAQAAADAHIERVAEDARALVSREVLATVDRHLDLARRAAGTLESAVVDRLADLLVDRSHRFDRVVVDTAPTGHTLRLLAMPELLRGWVGGLVRQRERQRGLDRAVRNLARDESAEADPVLARLQLRAERLAGLRRRIHDDAVVHLVTVPERLAIEETLRAEADLTSAGLRVGTLVVNQVIPDEADGEFISARREQQRTHLADLARRSRGWSRIEVPLLPHDVRGSDDLAAIAAHVATLLDDPAAR
jgi:arsenite/tail-anchored protein-transporting ATPase